MHIFGRYLQSTEHQIWVKKKVRKPCYRYKSPANSTARPLKSLSDELIRWLAHSGETPPGLGRQSDMSFTEHPKFRRNYEGRGGEIGGKLRAALGRR